MNFSIGFLIANLYVCENRAMKLTHPNEKIIIDLQQGLPPNIFFCRVVNTYGPPCTHKQFTIKERNLEIFSE